MFAIQKVPFGHLKRYILKNVDTEEYVSIIPSFGGNVNELVLKKKETPYHIIDGANTSKELLEDGRYKSAKLIPFANRIQDGRYIFNERRCQLPINHSAENHAIHGLLYNKPFRVIKKTQNKASAVLEIEYSYNNDIEGYPFRFQINIEYSFSMDGLKIQTTVVNKGISEMPFTDGWHPYFTLQEKVDDLSLYIPSLKKIEVDDRMIPAGKITETEGFTQLTKIGNNSFDTGFKIEKTDLAITEIYSPKKDVSIHVWQETGLNKYNFLQIFIPSDRNSIAIEPMTSNTNAFNNGDGLIILNPNDFYKNAYGVYIS